MKQERFEINLPFAGFYQSYHRDEIDRVVEDMFEGYPEIPDSLIDVFWDCADFGTARQEYAKAYVGLFGDEYLQGDVEFTTMTSPREYNFETDRIFATVGRKTLARLWRETDKAILKRVAHEQHTSYSGFISFYSPDYKSWGRLSEWDHNQLGTLLIAYLETERGEEWNQYAEFELCEDLHCNGYIDGWLWGGDNPKAGRAWQIYNYLLLRAGRMAGNGVAA